MRCAAAEMRQTVRRTQTLLVWMRHNGALGIDTMALERIPTQWPSRHRRRAIINAIAVRTGLPGFRHTSRRMPQEGNGTHRGSVVSFSMRTLDFSDGCQPRLRPTTYPRKLTLFERLKYFEPAGLTAAYDTHFKFGKKE